jgi:hypothetical protein
VPTGGLPVRLSTAKLMVLSAFLSYPICDNGGMGFGDASGPPASSKQMQYLQSLLVRAGFEGFGDARRPLGLTPKQARGKFGAREASALIDTLLSAETRVADNGNFTIENRSEVAVEMAMSKREEVAAEKIANERARMLQGITADLLAEELRRRGWGVTEP